MRSQVRQLLPLLAVTALLTVAGCTTHNNNAGYGYCDGTGCYQCDLDDNCWPLPNPTCNGDAVCAAGLSCTSIGCAKPCISTDECAGDESCVDGYCAPWGFDKVEPFVPPATCKSDEQCKADEFCDAGACKSKCTSDEDCGPDMFCSACGKCLPKGVPATCGSNQIFCSESVPCGDGKSCQAGRCHFQCAGSESCPVGQVCQSGLCTDDPDPAKPECSLDMDCGDGSCINGYCHASCKVGGDCGAGAVCLMGICQPDYTANN